MGKCQALPHNMAWSPFGAMVAQADKALGGWLTLTALVVLYHDLVL